MPHLVHRQSLSFHNVAFPSADGDSEDHFPPLCSLWDQSLVSAALHLAYLGFNKPPVCALHLSAWRSAAILTAVSRGAERRREGERMEEGWDRKGGRGERQSEWMTDALWLWLCPLFIVAASLFAGQRIHGGYTGGNQDEKLRRDKKGSKSAGCKERETVREGRRGGREW